MRDKWKEEPVSTTGAEYVEPSATELIKPGQRVSHLFPRAVMEEFVLQRVTELMIAGKMRILARPSHFQLPVAAPLRRPRQGQSSRADPSGHESERMTDLAPCK